MPLSDTKLTDWSVTPADNSPAGSEIINGGLDDQLRLLKAIIRSESLDKQWVDPNLTVSHRNSTSFYINGNHTGSPGSGAWASRNRKVRVTHNTSGQFVGYITSSSFADGKTTVIVEPDVFGSTIQADIAKVYFGAAEAVGNAVPNNYLQVDRPTMYTATVVRINNSINEFNAQFSAVETPLVEGQVYYLKFQETNQGPVWIRINNGNWLYEVQKPTYTTWASASVPVPVFAPLSAGDIKQNQVIAVVYEPGGPRFQLLTPLAGAISLTDLASKYFTVKNDSSSFDQVNCDSGGYITLMGSYAIQWCRVLPIAWANGSTPGQRVVNLPLGIKTGSLLSIVVTPIDATANLQLFVDTVAGSNGTQVAIKNSNASPVNGTAGGIPCYVLAVAKLA